MLPMPTGIMPFAQVTPIVAAPAAGSRPASTQAASQPGTDSSRYWDIGSGYHVGQGWLRVYSIETGLSGAGTLAGMLLAAWVLLWIFRRALARYRLRRAVRNGAIAIVIYMTIFSLHPSRMIDPKDIVAVALHKIFIAVMVIVGIRLVDRLVIVPLLTRGGKATISKFVHQIVIIVFSLFCVLVYCSWAFSLDISSFLAGSAVISIVLGLALQDTLGNFFSGMVLQASLPFQAGDFIQIGDVEGRVVEMTWRAVTVLTNDDNYVLIPNGSVSKEQIINFHSPSTATARTIVVGLEYDLPPNDARRVLLQAAAETEGVLPDPAPRVMLDSYGDSAINYKVKFWIDVPQKHGWIEHSVRTNAWYRLKQAGYGIPFPIRTVEMTNLDEKTHNQQAGNEARRITALANNPLFSALNADQRAQLARDARDITLGAGQIFYRQGDAGTSLFLLLEGKVDVFATTEDGREFDVGDILAGSFFGELSATTGAPRPRTIRASTDVRALEITREHLQVLFDNDPAAVERMSGVIAQREAEQLEQLSKLGEKPAASAQSGGQYSVLSSMKRMFGLI